jgi:hypothetical protein
MKTALYPASTALGIFLYGLVGAIVGLFFGLAVDRYYRKVI